MREKKPKKRQLWHKSPHDGKPGFAPFVLRFLYQIQGPSQLKQRSERAYIPNPNPSCPVCEQLMRDHIVDRGGPGKRTHLKCPTDITTAEVSN